MHKIWLMETGQGGQTVTTKIRQENPSDTQVQFLLHLPFRVENDIISARGSALDTLGDILLGMRLNVIQDRALPQKWHLKAAYRGTDNGRYRQETLERIMAWCQRDGCTAELIDLNTSALPDEFDAVFHLNRTTKERRQQNMMDYTMECPSFQSYVEANGGEKKSEGNIQPEALAYAHPLDASILRVLNNPVINKTFSRLVEMAVDAEYSLILSRGIRVDQKDPDVAEVLQHCADTLHIAVPYTVVSSSVSGINAVTAGSDEFHFIAISSMLKAVFQKEEMKFVLGHECGHIALGHVVYHSVLNTFRDVAELVPVLGPSVYYAASWPLKAWSRRSEISADRAGLLCCNDLDTACRTLLHLEAGLMDTTGFSVEDYIRDANAFLRQSSIGRFSELGITHPLLAKRMEALFLFANSEKYYHAQNLPIPPGVRLLSDQELEKRTEEIVKVL